MQPRIYGVKRSTVIDYFNKIDVDVLCAQECSKLSEAEIKAQGLYIHTHSNNGQGNVVSYRVIRFRTTPNEYGVYIDLGEELSR